MKSVSLLTGRGLTGILLLVALAVFEFINYTTTVAAVNSIIGVREVSLILLNTVQFATLIGLATCLLDFAGIARIFTPERGNDEPRAVYVLFFVWLCAAVINAGLTWWVASIWVATGYAGGNPAVSYESVVKWAPIILASLFFLIHFGLVYTIATLGDDLFAPVRGAKKTFNGNSKSGGFLGSLTGLFGNKSKPNKPQRPTPPVKVPGFDRRAQLEREFKNSNNNPIVPTIMNGGDGLEF